MTSKPFERIAADSNVILSAAVARNDRDFEELPLIVYPTARLLKVLGL